MTGLRKRSNQPRVDQEKLRDAASRKDAEVFNETGFGDYISARAKRLMRERDELSRRAESVGGHNRATAKSRAEIARRTRKK